MNIIFLDIDGVLNTERFQTIQVKNCECDWHEAQFNFDPICMNNLKEIINKFDAYVVITSTWRYWRDKNGQPWTELIGNFNKYNIKERIIDIIPILSKYNSELCRGDEIKEWLKNHNDISNFVIIDDENDMLDLSNKLVQCDYITGLTDTIKEKCFEILNNNDY